MDVGQIGGSVRPPPVHRAPQTAGVTAAGDFPAQQAEVRADEFGGHKDRHAASDQSRREGQDRPQLSCRFHGLVIVFAWVFGGFVIFLGVLDVVTIEKTGEFFRLIYDVKGRFTIHRITAEEAKVS